MKTKTKYVRIGKAIQDLETGKVETFDYVNQAKRRSRELQGAELGTGLLRIARSATELNQFKKDR